MKRLLACLVVMFFASRAVAASTTQPTTEDGSRYLLADEQLHAGAHHTHHAELFERGIDGYNLLVLRAIDKVQSTAPDGGGYFIGAKAKPTESPIGYPLALFESALLDPPRKSSYCSGATYTAFIETLNLLLPDRKLTPQRSEAMRMQEPDGGRREDGVKFWGHWNDDGPGCQYALVQYAKMGVELAPLHARPGDFLNINWKTGNGHSVVFLGWHVDAQNNKQLMYWASQTGTNGLGDQLVKVERIASVKLVRLTTPENLFKFDPTTSVNRKIEGDPIDW